jgi:hypothetical protein
VTLAFSYSSLNKDEYDNENEDEDSNRPHYQINAAAFSKARSTLQFACTRKACG